MRSYICSSYRTHGRKKEVSFQDMQGRGAKSEAGYTKFVGSCKTAVPIGTILMDQSIELMYVDVNY